MSTERHAELSRRLEEAVARVLHAEGVELVELHLRGTSRRRLLRVDIDRAGPHGVGLEDCKRVSDALGKSPDVDALIPGSYLLEVSSPGVDRPIRTEDDVRRNSGRRVRVTTGEPIDGRREFVGLLLGLEAGRMALRLDDASTVEIGLSDVRSARQEVGF